MGIVVLSSSWPLGPRDWRGHFVREWCLAIQEQGMPIRVLVPAPREVMDRDASLPVDFLPAILPRPEAGFHGHGLEVEIGRNPHRIVGLPVLLTGFVLEALPRCLGAEALVAHWVWPMGLVAATISNVLGIPFGIVAHSGPPAPARLPGLSGLWRYPLERARSVACVSDAVSSILEPGTLSTRVTIPLGVSVGPFVARPTSERFRVLFVGRMVSLKGGDVLIRAIAGMSGVLLTMVGSGPEGSRWRGLAHEYGVSVRFLADLSPGEVLAEMAGADLLVVPSRRGPGGRVEGMPRVILEAWSRGLPVVTSDAGGGGEVVRRWGGGVVVPPGDEGALRVAMKRLIDHPQERERLREEAWRAAWAHRWEVLGPRWVEWARSLSRKGPDATR